MGILIKKRQLLAASLVIALAAAVTVNWYYSKSDVTVEPSVTNESVQGHLGDSLLVAGTAVDSTGETGETSETGESAEAVAKFFADAQNKKNEYVDTMKDEIEDLMESDNLDDKSKEKITDLLNKLNESVRAQTDCENLIKAKLSGECIVIIKDNSAEVIVEQGKLNDTSSMQITEIIEKNAKVPAENLTIIEAK